MHKLVFNFNNHITVILCKRECYNQFIMLFLNFQLLKIIGINKEEKFQYYRSYKISS